MESIKDIYTFGPGPSSSHTIGPYKASLDFISNLKDKDNIRIEVTLCGSLALTGKGHLTDKIIIDTLKDYKVRVIFNYKIEGLIHPNTMEFIAFNNKNEVIKECTYFSVGGGKIDKNTLNSNEIDIYPFNSFDEIKDYMTVNKIDSLNELVDKFEDKDINEYLNKSIDIMLNSVEEGLSKEGVLPGKLEIHRVARELYKNSINLDGYEKVCMLLTSFAYAVSEVNASGGMVVTAPTCGSAGIIPAILYYEEKYKKLDRNILINSLKIGGLFGNIAKKNASISGARSGCQAEIGVASAMGAAIISYINNLSLYQIEYASEVALEHFLGLTCDPVLGYVQIPCIERNGIGVLRSYNSYLYAKNIAPLRKNRVSYDEVIKAMKETGDDLNSDYKETSEGGLAKLIK